MIPTLNNHKMSPAAICRANGWGVGTRLVGDEGHGPEVIEISAMGREAIMAFSISLHGEPADTWSRESSWVLSCRDWKPVSSEDTTNGI